MGETEAALLEEMAMMARAGADPASFADVYDRFFPRAYQFVRFRVPDRSTADDLTAQIFEKALERIGTFRPQNIPFAAWLFSIARNCVNDHLRRRRRRRWFSLDILRSHAGPGNAPDQNLIRTELASQLQIALQTLKDRDREIISLKFGAGLTNRRISQATGMKEATVAVTEGSS